MRNEAQITVNQIAGLPCDDHCPPLPLPLLLFLWPHCQQCEEGGSGQTGIQDSNFGVQMRIRFTQLLRLRELITE